MQTSISTTPFGRRPYSLTQMEPHLIANACPQDALVDKWKIYDDVCAAKAAIGLSDRSLTVLKALLSFHPDTVLTGDGPVIVFPSNKNLAKRASGMAENTLRRHLATLVETGVIIRRDSPNGKRYARKGEGGEIETAFGFDLTLIVARAAEFQRLAAEAKAAEQVLRHLRERITIFRRDIDKMIATGSYEGVPADWTAIHVAFKGLGGRIPRKATSSILEPLAIALEALAREIHAILESHVKTNNMSGNATQNGRHIQNSTPNPIFDSELGLPISQGTTIEPHAEPQTPPPARQAAKPQQKFFPLGMILEACPDIADHARDGIKSWRDLVVTAESVRPMLGISPSAWEAAIEVLGPIDAAIVLAAILQRSAAIASPGGYLRSLTEKARAGAFSLGPVLMALIRANMRKDAPKKRA